MTKLFSFIDLFYINNLIQKWLQCIVLFLIVYESVVYLLYICNNKTIY